MTPATRARHLVLLAFFTTTWPRTCDSTCVLESDFGVVINCAFKKSSLFRVRNLGGVKAHISWGLTLGDELGFKESLSNSEMNRRRAAPASKAQVQFIEAQQDADEKKKDQHPGNHTDIHLKPTSKPPSTLAPLPTLKEIFSTPPSESNGAPFKVNFQKGNPTSPATLKDTFSTPPSDSNKAPFKTHHQNSKPHPPATLTDISSTPSSKENEISYKRAVSKPRSIDKSNQEHPAPTNSTLMNIFQYIRDRFRAAATTTVPPAKKRLPPPGGKTPRKKTVARIGAAPKEYHPMGYSRNTTSSSRLKLPKTSFQCKEQKYFPGLYADEELGCSVFHVCAVLDTAELVTRSFLCPESTLFDQSMLKCNWWFYVDCAASKEQYEINMPVAKSYQLMRALATASPRPETSAENGNATVIQKQDV